MSDSHPVRNGILIVVISALLLSLAKLVPRVTVALWHWACSLTSLLLAALATRWAVPVWLLILLVALSGPAVLAVARLLAPVRKGKEDSESWWLEYTEDRNLFGVVWRWEYRHGDIFGLGPYCPRCDAALVYERKPGDMWGDRWAARDSIVFLCERCNIASEKIPGRDLQDAMHRADSEIRRRIRTEEAKPKAFHEAQDR